MNGESAALDRMQRCVCSADLPELEALLGQVQDRLSDHDDWRWHQVHALALWRLGRAEQALQALDQRIVSLQKDPETWVLRGLAWRQLPHGAQQSLAAYQEAHRLDPERADVLYNIGNCLLADQPERAAPWFHRSLRRDPFQPLCWYNLGLLLLNADQPEQAQAAFRWAVLLDPSSSDAWCNLGLSLVKQAKPSQAQTCFQAALALNQQHCQSHSNLGNVLMEAVKPQAALPHLQQGAADGAKARLNLGLCRLLLGDFEQGWVDYEARLAGVDSPSSGPQVHSLADAKRLDSPLLVWCEQGLGDTIMFARYLALLDAAKIRYRLSCQSSLFPLLSRWLSAQGEIVKHTDVQDSSQHHTPLLSLPRLFNTKLGTIPGVLPYLGAPNEPPPHLRVPSPPGGLAVGLVWASDPANRVMYRHKSIPLSAVIPRLLDLVDLDLIDLHCLQVGDDAAQLDPWRQHPRITDWSPHLDNFEATAYVVNQLDLVISVDTAVAHLAGALRKPTWLLLAANADFRWLRDRADSPWYPNVMRLFRQQTPGDWSGPIGDLHAALNQLFLLDLDALVAAKLKR